MTDQARHQLLSPGGKPLVVTKNSLLSHATVLPGWQMGAQRLQTGYQGPKQEGLGGSAEDGPRPAPVPTTACGPQFLSRCTNSCTGLLILYKGCCWRIPKRNVSGKSQEEEPPSLPLFLTFCFL
uniref:Uncharacterized protein n=1 Tax=Pipistrellus kuhlii TaxID=59472 RepID=A0A7J7V0E8_PIPKU|nr:hypothetical protein mPipKuh1_008628 [Pipistrellus kuhlii]